MGVFGGDWHSDFSFLPAPPSASILYAEDIPPVGGDTLWVDMVQVLSRLAPELRAALEGRDAIHVGAPYGVRYAPADDTRFNGSIEIERNNPEADRETRHPAICRHPETGESLLFINPTYTIRIDGYSESESSALLPSPPCMSARASPVRPASSAGAPATAPPATPIVFMKSRRSTGSSSGRAR